ncbi:unnamed protein product [Acanthoscelides obtectus]|uniref:Uncharacterized protein n=1 Tax=Acanthoscelides obtectus TaxID=200917 RepID=A0A9P0JVB7_ACAOB|nr:unnamed protein product [Acanthoscelides obtectus]CAK1668490.1 hypothetical protein AOBTE_LOCUS26434 [Acanthoscelides obtectus]
MDFFVYISSVVSRFINCWFNPRIHLFVSNKVTMVLFLYENIINKLNTQSSKDIPPGTPFLVEGEAVYF